MRTSDDRIIVLATSIWETNMEIVKALKRFLGDSDFDRFKLEMASMFKNSRWEMPDEHRKENDPHVGDFEGPNHSSEHVQLNTVDTSSPIAPIAPSMGEPLSNLEREIIVVPSSEQLQLNIGDTSSPLSEYWNSPTLHLRGRHAIK